MQSKQIEGFRLSPQQKHLWLLQQREGAQPCCVLGEICITGRLDLERLKEALQTLVDRHEILRTTFRYLPGMTIPLQVIVDNSAVAICEQDLSCIPSHAQEAEVALRFNQLKQQAFEFEVIPPFFAHILTLSSEKQILLIHASPLIADSTTLKQIMRELSVLYSEKMAHAALANDAIQYVDVAELHHEMLEQMGQFSGQEYWRKTITAHHKNSGLSFLERKGDRTTSALQVELVSLTINQDLVEQIKSSQNLRTRFEPEPRVAIATFLLSCWQILLWRITGQPELMLGITSSGRQHEALANALGPLSKCLPLLARLEPDLAFWAVLKHVGESLDRVVEWQDQFTWEDIATQDAPLSSPLCPFGFEFEEWPENCWGDGVSFSLHRQYVWRERFKVNLCCLQRGDGLIAEFHYDSSLYQREEIEALSTCFLTLLEHAINNPELPIGQLQLLNDRQQQQILVEFNQTQTDYCLDHCIHQRFEAQVNQTPNDIAVVYEDQQLTYAELNAKANQLAHYLQRLDVGTEAVVGIYLERSLEFIISLLAILKTGGAYLPLDPALPKASLEFRLQDAQVARVLSQAHLIENLPDSIPFVCLEHAWEVIAQERQDNPTSGVTSHNLAYVLFTSGSTGKPKGVAVEHRQLLNYTSAIAKTLNLSTCKSFATVSTFAADLGNTTIFPALVSGGCLHIVSAECASNPDALADYVQAHPIDCLKIVPSHLAALLTASRPEQILPRQRLILGGEACPWPLIEQIQRHKPQCLIFNHYGPTETTVGALTYAITRETLNARPPYQETVPIGRPIGNTQIYVLDADLRPVPIGVPGNLFIGGAGVARGYLNRPELTAERFLPNPFWDDIGDNNYLTSDATSSHPLHFPKPSFTLYKTGDLARYQLDGTIEFLGRVDYQVKIRGYRIELGEIEAALRQHPAVQTAIALAVEAQPGNKRLVAYIVPEKHTNPTTDELRERLTKTLPDYMIPSAFVQLKTLPLTPNGKLDYQALQSPDLLQSEREETFVASRTKPEEILAQIWRQTLRLEKVGIHDNFFELGGDSILSIQIVARANQAGLQLMPKQVFENQTIAQLAAVATTKHVVHAEQGIVVGDVPLTPIQHWFFEQTLPDAHHWNQSIFLEVQQALDPVLLQQAMKKLLEHHDALRLRFVHDGSWQQFAVEPDGNIPLTWVNLSALSGTHQTRALSTAAAELQASLHLSSVPIRVAYFDLGADQSSRLLLIIHHLVVDGVSWRILLEDLQLAYQHLSQGNSIQLPPKTTSFHDWSNRLTEYAQSDALKQELGYWLEQSRPAVVPIPVDFSASSNTVAEARTVSVALNEAETLALLQDIPATYRTQINDVLLTALVQAFSPWTGKRSLWVDLEGHGREDLFDHVDLSRTVGWFTTLFPVLLDIEESANPGEALKAIKEQLRRIPNRGIGYGILRYLTTEEISLRQQPDAEIRFNYLGQTDQAFQSPLFGLAQDSMGAGRSFKGNRRYRLDINAAVYGNQLHLDWTYSKTIHQQTTIAALAERFIAALRSLITHCQSSDIAGYTPSDFAEADLNQQELDQFLAKIKSRS